MESTLRHERCVILRAAMKAKVHTYRAADLPFDMIAIFLASFFHVFNLSYFGQG